MPHGVYGFFSFFFNFRLNLWFLFLFLSVISFLFCFQLIRYLLVFCQPPTIAEGHRKGSDLPYTGPHVFSTSRLPKTKRSSLKSSLVPKTKQDIPQILSSPECHRSPASH